MKILLLSQYFHPENFKINDLAKELKQRGHDVVVFTGKPNYPTGKFYKGYGFFSRSKEYFEGIKVIRVPLIPRGKSGAVGLSLNYMSFVFFGVIRMLFFREKFDATFIFAVSPITSAYPAFVNRKKHGKICIWVQDLWPESVEAAGGMSSESAAYKIIDKMVRRIYSRCDVIAVQSPAFAASVAEKNEKNREIVYIPNWAEELYVNRENADRVPDGFPSIEGFKVVFTGNIGEAQDVDNVLKAAELTRHHKDIKWVLVGDGRKAEEVRAQIKGMSLQETVLMPGRYPVDCMPYIMSNADVLLMSLKREHIFSLTIPSKLQSYMASAKPVVCMADGISGEIVRESQCGLAANSGDYRKLAENVIALYEKDHAALRDMGQNGHKFYLENFDKKKVIDNLIEVLK